MALRDLAQAAYARPDGITCPKYVRLGESKRCAHYVANGSCALPDEFMCSEWLKSNGHASARAAEPRSLPVVDASAATPPASVERDLFGNPVVRAPVALTASPPASPSRLRADVPAVDFELLRGLSDADLASFRANGLEVCIQSDAFGEIWLVPEYTGAERKEITPESAATILRVLAVFPGSCVTAFIKAQPKAVAPRKEPAAP
ncbi:hypothetical protein LZC95_50050 [Pendulispora brunnea]|uniref:Uncharacterized protein n=1 Tax=Pendulispora brunnea TaxID=2905690 RepID=A0ABZ2K8Y6_9BACT